jgi:orotate phosphoribosyltransferase
MSSATINQSSLAKAISEVALLRGTFTLRSGKTSSYYLDKYLFSTRPELLRQLSPLFARAIGTDGEEIGEESRAPGRGGSWAGFRS